MSPQIPNPWLTLGGIPSPRGAAVASLPPVAAAAIQSERYDEATAGYACCYNCGHREPCDEYCPQFSKVEAQLEREIRELTAGFEVEPLPEFLTQDQRIGDIETLLQIARERAA